MGLSLNRLSLLPAIRAKGASRKRERERTCLQAVETQDAEGFVWAKRTAVKQGWLDLFGREDGES